MADVIVIGIAGGTGSGKTTLVKALINRFGDDISVLSHDNYYKRHDDLTYEERTKLNYDHPDIRYRPHDRPPPGAEGRPRHRLPDV